MISRVFIATYKHDVNFARTCVASIRYYYPSIPITLIKDYYYGNYSTKDIEKNWNVDILSTYIKKFGWGFSKLEPLFLEKKEKILILDADTVIIGKIIDKLNQFPEEFIVSGQVTDKIFQETQYYDPIKIKEFDPLFTHPDYGFNTGQIVATTGIFKREEFNNLIDYKNLPEVKDNSLFKYGEQGLLNYFLFKACQNGRIKLRNYPYMHTGNNKMILEMDTSIFNQSFKRSIIVHWCGLRQKKFKNMPSGWILINFEKYFYSKVKYGFFVKISRKLLICILSYLKHLIKFFLFARKKN